MKQMVFLVPGFFGFKEFGDLNYFNGVKPLLERKLSELGADAEVVELHTLPTSSIRRRAADLLQTIEGLGALEASDLVLVGHSTGGLDARMAATPGVQLVAGDLEERIGRKLRGVVTVATPHYGTPIALFFNGLQGRNILFALASSSASRPGRYAIALGAQVLSLIARLDDLFGQRNTGLDFLAERLLRDIKANDDGPVWDFIRSVAHDQGAIVQLTPEAMDIFNAAVTNRPGVRYSSVIAAAPPPPRSFVRSKIRSVYTPLSMGLYSLTYLIASRYHEAYPYPEPTGEQAAMLEQALGAPCTPRSNDGIVPTLSAIWGELLHVAEADHLDVVGQFDGAGAASDYAGWLASGSRFGQRQFEKLWGAVAREVAASLDSAGARAQAAGA
ncbi:MAG TPA: triacylglycerol lipase [Myxococcales bacterium]|nr:triacylglycerol lipase [Myxococcales bacterium]